MDRYLAVKSLTGDEAYIVDTQSPGDGADGAVIAVCANISQAVYYAGQFNA